MSLTIEDKQTIKALFQEFGKKILDHTDRGINIFERKLETRNRTERNILLTNLRQEIKVSENHLKQNLGQQFNSLRVLMLQRFDTIAHTFSIMAHRFDMVDTALNEITESIKVSNQKLLNHEHRISRIEENIHAP